MMAEYSRIIHNLTAEVVNVKTNKYVATVRVTIA